MLSPRPVRQCDRPERSVRRAFAVAWVAGLLALAGCASSSSSGGFMDRALDAVGLQTRPSVPDLPSDLPPLPKFAKKVTLRIHAGEVLNTDSAGRSLSLVARIYKLKDAAPFLQAPYEAFKETTSGKPAPLDGVVEMREVVLTPGQKYEVVETLAPEVTHLAVVGMFRAPDDKRWRFVFDAKGAASTGVTMGAHGCAFSVSVGQPVESTPEEMRLAGVRCR